MSRILNVYENVVKDGLLYVLKVIIVVGVEWDKKGWFEGVFVMNVLFLSVVILREDV